MSIGFSVDIDKVKKDKEAQEARDAAVKLFGVPFYKLKDGDNRLRIMPPWTNKGPHAFSYYAVGAIHWKLGAVDGERIHVLCGKKTPWYAAETGGRCEVCVLVDHLKKSSHKEDKELGKELFANLSWMLNVVDLADPVYTQKEHDEQKAAGNDPSWSVGDTKVQIFTANKTVHGQIAELFTSYSKDLTDMQTGRGVTIKKVKKPNSEFHAYTTVPDMMDSVFVYRGNQPLPDLDEALKRNLREIGDIRAAIASYSGEPAALPPSREQIRGSLPPANPNQRQLQETSFPIANQSAANRTATSPSARGMSTLPPDTHAAPIGLPSPGVQADAGNDEDDLPCFGDVNVFSESDAQCVGGRDTDGREYDPCPKLLECKAICKPEPVVAPPTRRGRRPAAPVSKEPPAPNDALAEAQRALEEALNA